MFNKNFWLICLVFIISLIMLLSFGCATYKPYKPPMRYNIENGRVFHKSFEMVWNKAIEWMAMNNMPIKNMDKGSGFIASEFNLVAEQTNYLDCGTAAGVSWDYEQHIVNGRGNFNILIQKLDEENTKIIINAFFKATIKTRVLKDYSSEEMSCNSTGVLEKKVLDYLGEVPENTTKIIQPEVVKDSTITQPKKNRFPR